MKNLYMRELQLNIYITKQKIMENNKKEKKEQH